MAGVGDLSERFAEIASAVIPTQSAADWDLAESDIPAAAQAHPGWLPVLRGLSIEPGLARFIGPRGFQVSDGLGFQGWAAEDLAWELLLASWRRMDIMGLDGEHRQPDIAARAALDDARQLGLGETVEVPACILWDGPVLERDVTLRGAFGSFLWKESIPPPYKEAPPHEGSMLYTTLPVEVTELQTKDADPSFWGSGNVTQQAVNRLKTQVRLALAEDGINPDDGSPYDPHSGPPARVALIDISTPWFSGHFELGSMFDPAEIREEVHDPEAFRERLDFYVRNWRPEIDLAGRRLAASAESLWREDDALVDAVTAWESMVGSDTEITFRLSAALAHLLRSDFDERKALARELKQIYGTRSKIVHGAKDLTVDHPEELHDQRLRAIEIGTEALRALLSQRADLLQLKSSDRNERLLLE